MLNQIAVLGAGTMGHGIAQVFAQKGFKVYLYDPSPKSIETAKLKLRRNLTLIQEQFAEQTITIRELEEVLVYTSDLTFAVEAADLIIECAPERLEIKQELFAQISPHLKEGAIVASNTSSFSLEALADGHPFADRMMIIHFVNPAPFVPLVELVQLPQTQTDVPEQVMKLLIDCGKVPVLLKKDITGFIINRLQAAIVREASFLLENGIADAEQIDLVMTEGPGMRWAMYGPFRIADLGGLDTWEKVLTNLFPHLDNSTVSPQIFRDKVAEGHFGVKTGQGLYAYSGPEELVQLEDGRDRQFIELEKIKRN